MTPTDDLMFTRAQRADGTLFSHVAGPAGASGEITGGIVEGQFALDQEYLVLATQDSPYEERLDVTLLDKAMQVLDTLAVQFVYTPGIVSDIAVIDEHSLRLRFVDETPWTIRVLDRKKLRGPFSRPADPAGVARPVGLYRRLVIEHSPR